MSEAAIIQLLKPDAVDWNDFYSYLIGMTAPLVLFHSDRKPPMKEVDLDIALAIYHSYCETRLVAPVQQDIKLFVEKFNSILKSNLPSMRELH